jgi:hypothetical protein
MLLRLFPLAASVLLLSRSSSATRSAGRAPPMGWSSWNTYNGEINAQLLMDTATKLTELGLPALGYDRFNIDGGWEDVTGPPLSPPRPGSQCHPRPCRSHPNQTYCPNVKTAGQCDQPMPHAPCPPGPCPPAPPGPPGCATRDKHGMLQAYSSTFPGGLAPVARHVNGLGLQWGMYLPFHACPGTNTSAFDHPAADIGLCAELNATMVKVDALGFSRDAATTERAMRVFEQAIRNSSKPNMLFSNCHMGCMAVHETRRGGWAPWCSQYGDMWRTSNDINADWANVVQNLDTLVGRGQDAGPFCGWNDPDILEVGVTRPKLTPLTLIEAESHFSLWCVTSSPLLLGMPLVGPTVCPPISV